MSQRMNIWGYSFDPETGQMYDSKGRVQPYTFQYATILDTYTGRVVPANPIHFATLDTAEKVLEKMKSLAPGADLKLTQSAWVAGPFIRPVVEYGIQLPGGDVMCCGLVANTLMRNGAYADEMLRDELATCGVKTNQ